MVRGLRSLSMSLEEVQLAKKNNMLLNQEEDPEELPADDESFDRHGIAQMEDVTDSANCTDKPGMAPATKKAPDGKFGNLGLPENNYGKTQEGDIGSLSLGIPECEQTNVALHYVDTKRGRRVSNVKMESDCKGPENLKGKNLNFYNFREAETQPQNGADPAGQQSRLQEDKPADINSESEDVDILVHATMGGEELFTTRELFKYSHRVELNISQNSPFFNGEKFLSCC